MKFLYTIAFLILCSVAIVTGQAKYKCCSSINVSQNTNYCFYKSSHHQVFISSWDGLNIFDGQETRTYRPLTHHMAGNRMEDTFYEDTSGIVWFTTSEALHYYNPKTDSLDYIFMVNASGDTLRSNHSAFQLSGNDLYLRAENDIFIYDVVKRTIKKTIPFDFSKTTPIDVFQDLNTPLLFCINSPNYEMYAIEDSCHRKWVSRIEGELSSVYCSDSKKIWLGMADGKLIQLDPQNGHVLFQSPLVGIKVNGIVESTGNRLLLNVHPNEIIEYDPTRDVILDRFVPMLGETKEAVNYLLPPFMDRDSTIWFGGASQGVFFFNPRKQKFQHFLNTGSDQKPFNISSILPLTEHTYLIITRRQGIVMINEKGDILRQWLDLPDGVRNFTSTDAAQIDDHQFLFNSNSQLYVLDLKSGKIKKLQTKPSNTNLVFDQIEKFENGKIIASCGDSLLQEIQLSNYAYTCRPYGNLKGRATRTNDFKLDQAGNLYVSNDDASVLVLSPSADDQQHRFSYELSIKGGVRSLLEDQAKSGIYLTNTFGLFHIRHDTKEVTQIVDKENILAQTIYAAIADTAGNFWLSSNKGILKYNPKAKSVKVYSRMDGVQADEFNSNAYHQTADGHIFFGGINGINYFHPDEVVSSTKEAPVYIRSVKINDELDSTILVPEFKDTYELTYKQNTISFDFHAIDYSDPDATRVKYQLVGVDPEYIESQSAKGFARYANLRHGTYTLLLLGANADGHWNETPRAIEIIIHPPYYLTWWFITLCVLLAIGIIYGLVRLYYQRQLEKRNQIVREQALIIEKQKAVEYERNRIASEMHDDLGSGLTTIRYLSDKALKQARDSAETEQIKRISEHSKRLVRNMSEIIWAMNSRFDSAENLVGYLRRYASEYLEEYQLPLKFVSGLEHLDQVSMGGEKRRNVFLVFKEMLHNAVKYSGAERLEIEITTNHQLGIHIAEIGGKGFDPELALEKGNGIFNCRKRMHSAGGELTFEKTAEAMHIHIIVPIKPEAGG
ncbi:MAG: hypothetical protein IPP25_09780 [Saprospiraceae bacterium]|nr:hypothetical protein [Candidatus Opimibacter skivensis]